MAITVETFDDAQDVLDLAGAFLAGRPVAHNLILTLLRARAAEHQPGRYWLACEGGEVRGLAFQSPVSFPAALTPMPADVVCELAAAMADSGVDLPGVGGEAGTAARFAGQWAESRRSPARPGHALRLYEAKAVSSPFGVTGGLRLARTGERDLLVGWLRAMREVVPPPGPDPEETVARGLANGRLWVWDDDGPASICAESAPVESVVRIQAVYTPPARRQRGYAGAGVAALTGRVLARGERAILYADLANPVSNSIYRGIGYRAVAECLSYAFEPAVAVTAAGQAAGPGSATHTA